MNFEVIEWQSLLFELVVHVSNGCY